MTIGKLEKRTRKNILNKLFLNKDEAYYYAKLYDGKVRRITDSELIVDIGDEEHDI